MAFGAQNSSEFCANYDADQTKLVAEFLASIADRPMNKQFPLMVREKERPSGFWGKG